MKNVNGKWIPICFTVEQMNEVLSARSGELGIVRVPGEHSDLRIRAIGITRLVRWNWIKQVSG